MWPYFQELHGSIRITQAVASGRIGGACGLISCQLKWSCECCCHLPCRLPAQPWEHAQPGMRPHRATLPGSLSPHSLPQLKLGCYTENSVWRSQFWLKGYAGIVLLNTKIFRNRPTSSYTRPWGDDGRKRGCTTPLLVTKWRTHLIVCLNPIHKRVYSLDNCHITIKPPSYAYFLVENWILLPPTRCPWFFHSFNKYFINSMPKAVLENKMGNMPPRVPIY